MIRFLLKARTLSLIVLSIALSTLGLVNAFKHNLSTEEVQLHLYGIYL